MSDSCQSSVSQASDTRPSNVSIGKDSIGKVSIGKDSIGERDNAPARGFIPPTVKEVTEYAKANNLAIDAQKFWDYYAGRAWTMGNASMADWQAAVRNWARRDAERKAEKTAPKVKAAPPTMYYSGQRETAGGSWEELDKLHTPGREMTDEEFEAMMSQFKNRRDK